MNISPDWLRRMARGDREPPFPGFGGSSPALCTVYSVQYMEPFFVPSVLPPRDRLDQLNTALF